MTGKPEKPPAPPLVELEDAREIFVTDVVGAGVIGGCISINLAAHRWSVSEPGQDPEIHRALVARLVLSREAAMQLAQSLANLSQAGRPAGDTERDKSKVSAKK